MISFKEYFLEAYIHNNPFTSDPPEKEGEHTYTYTFETDKDVYVCKFSGKEIDIPETGIKIGYEFAFGDKKEDGTVNLVLKQDVSFSDKRRIFATVEEIIDDFFKTKNADAIYFLAISEEPTRVRFYKFLLRFLQKKYKYRYVNIGGMSIIFNPKMGDKEADKFEKHIKEYMKFSRRGYTWSGKRNENGTSQYNYGKYIKILVSEPKEEKLRTDDFFPTTLYFLKILNVSEVDDDGTTIYDGLTSFFDHIIHNFYRDGYIVIDTNKNDRYYKFYKIMEEHANSRRLIKRRVVNKGDRIISYISY